MDPLIAAAAQSIDSIGLVVCSRSQLGIVIRMGSIF